MLRADKPIPMQDVACSPPSRLLDNWPSLLEQETGSNDLHTVPSNNSAQNRGNANASLPRQAKNARSHPSL